MNTTVQEVLSEGPAPSEAAPPEKPDDKPAEPFFILYLSGSQYSEELTRLTFWVERLLLPVYGAEVTSNAPWCPRWQAHPEAVGQLHALWLAWQSKTSATADAMGPLEWHRDCLGPVMDRLRQASGPFAGCKLGAHRAKERPPSEVPINQGPPRI